MDWQKIDLNLLVVFAEIARCGSVTEASKALGLSQPATSYALQRLRNTLGDPLFVKVGKQMQPTARAIAIEPVVRELLERIQVEVLRPGSFDPRTLKRCFRIAMSDIGESYFVPPLVRALQENAPEMSLQVHSISPRQLEAALESGEIDLALGHHPDLVGAGVHQQALFTSRFVVLSGAQSEHKVFSIDEFQKRPHVDVCTPGRNQEMIQLHMKQLAIPRQVQVRVSRFLSLPEILKGSEFLAVVPLEVAQYLRRVANLGVSELPFESPSFRLMQHWHSRFQDEPALKWLREQIRLQFGRSD